MLDICCGSGDIAFLLAEKVGPQGKVCISLSLSLPSLCFILPLRPHMFPSPQHNYLLLVPSSTLSFMGQFGYCEAIPIPPTIILVYLLQAASGLLEGYGQDAPTTTSYEHNYKCVVGDRSRFCKGAAGYCNSASTGVCNCFINRHAVSCSLILCVSPSHPVLIVHLSIPCYRRDAAKLAPLH